eukprot:Gb_36498 [translate_table: standard]
MDTGIALNALRGSSVSASPRGLTAAQNNTFFTGSPLLPCKRINALGCQGLKKNRGVLLVEAKGKKGMAARLYQQRPPPTLPKAEDDNPRFLLFIRTKKFPRWYPVSIITGGTTAKLMVAAKNTPIGKGIYESTLTRNMAGVVYKRFRNPFHGFLHLICEPLFVCISKPIHCMAARGSDLLLWSGFIRLVM